MTDDREVILKVENLRTWFPVKKGTFKKVVDHVKAVDDVSLEIYKGETLGIVGESGCGKSTFGKSIMRLEQITDGKVIFNYDGQFKDVAQFDKKEMFEFRKKVLLKRRYNESVFISCSFGVESTGDGECTAFG